VQDIVLLLHYNNLSKTGSAGLIEKPLLPVEIVPGDYLL
jgi:hypothetical protein